MITRRVLTMRSVMGVGKYPNETVERLLRSDNAKYIRAAYYNFEQIDFVDEVKQAAGIYIEIPKPGTARHLFLTNEHKVWEKRREELGDEEYMKEVAKARRMQKATKTRELISERLDGLGIKAVRQAYNQGKLKRKPNG